MRKIIFTRPDGGVSVVVPAINTLPDPEKITEAEAEQRAWDKLPTIAINPRFVTDAEIPTDRTFRNAWEDSAGIKVNMPKARDIHKERLRTMRAPKLAKLDVDYIRADEAGNTALKVKIAGQKRALRDVTVDSRIVAATTPEELKNVIPSVLL